MQFSLFLSLSPFFKKEKKKIWTLYTAALLALSLHSWPYMIKCDEKLSVFLVFIVSLHVCHRITSKQTCYVLILPGDGLTLSATPWYGLQTDQIHKTPESLQNLSHFHFISLCFRGRHNLYNEQHPDLMIKISLHSCICSGCLIVSATVAAQIMSVFTSCW